MEQQGKAKGTLAQARNGMRRRLLRVAVAAVLATGIPAGALKAQQTVISASSNATVPWTGGDLLILEGVSLPRGVAASANAVLGSLENRGNTGAVNSFYGLQLGQAQAIAVVRNTGTIAGYYAAIDLGLTPLTTLVNDGRIVGGIDVFSGHIGTIANGVSGVIDGGNVAGIMVALSNTGGTIDSLDNRGTISGRRYGVSNYDGTISTLLNTGRISGGLFAISNTTAASQLGPITNSGSIEGTIENLAAQDLTFHGSTDDTPGVLTGYGAGNGGLGADNIGLIFNRTGNVVFADGNQLLNDHIDVGTGQVILAGGQLQINHALTITGNYAQQAPATLLVGVGDEAVSSGYSLGHGRLTISGQATAAAGSHVVLTALDTHTFAQGQRFVVAQATEAGTAFQADQLLYRAAGYAGPVKGQTGSQDGTTYLVLTLGAIPPTPPPTTPEEPGNPEQPGTPEGPGTPDQPGTPEGPGTPDEPPVLPTDPAAFRPINRASRAGARLAIDGLFRYEGFDEGLINLFDAVATTGTGAEADRAGAQLSPVDVSVATAQAAQVPTQQVLGITLAHLDGLRAARAGTAAPATEDSVWGQVFGGQTQQGTRQGVAGYRTNGSGLLVGADTDAGDAWRVGGLVSYATTQVRNQDAGQGSGAQLRAYGAIGYASYTGPSAYVNLSLGALRQTGDTYRQLAFAHFVGQTQGRYDGDQVVSAVQAGVPVALGEGATTLTPVLGLTYSRLHQNAYQERGGAAALQIGSTSSPSLRSDLGARWDGVFASTLGQWSPYAQAGWRHEYRQQGLRGEAVFVADTSGVTGFSLLGPRPVSDTGVLSVGTTLQRDTHLSFTVSYTLEAGGGFRSRTGDLLLRYRF